MSLTFSPSIRWMAAFTLLSWLGEYIHNRFELPQLTLLSPENSIPALISVVLFLAWWRLPQKRLTAWVLFAWALLHLLGGAVISVIPFPFLPFYPEQSISHYLVHVWYGIAQLPLLVTLWRQLHRSNGWSGAKA
jgi:hypothetical protein